ncbi:hypothetical protein [Candidatus Hodarchaeum mangrovi]
MKIEEFAKKNLGFKDPFVLQVYQGYLIGGKVKKNSKCFWINKQNIEGLAEVAKVVAIESTFHGILSFIPGGSLAYRLIKDQLGYPPRYNVIIDPEFYRISYSIISLDKKGQPKGLAENVMQSVDNIAKYALKTGDSIKDLLKKEKTQSQQEIKEQEDQILGFTYIRFIDLVSEIRNQIIQRKLTEANSRAEKLTKSVIAELTPSIVMSFKTTANEEALIFLENLKKLGFTVEFVKYLS